ncbi:unnamed protein product [Acanthocheilonema viteae]|uniref:PX domain-containing protein n=1 Tax=Acanthocheilonema viteae TaxID=6277 RepID=A0A498SLX8_ACAVI|nr:unnamed protein product [Acanthocheilonema viteae]
MALLDLDNIAPRLEGNSMISIPHYKIKDGKYAVYVIRVAIDSTVWTIEKRYSDFVAFDLQRFEDRKKSFLPPKKLVGNLDLEFLNERRIELEKYIRTVVELDLWTLSSGHRKKEICELSYVYMSLLRVLKVDTDGVKMKYCELERGSEERVENLINSVKGDIYVNILSIYFMEERRRNSGKNNSDGTSSVRVGNKNISSDVNLLL